jgi:hypothetical protein
MLSAGVSVSIHVFLTGDKGNALMMHSQMGDACWILPVVGDDCWAILPTPRENNEAFRGDLKYAAPV